MSLESARKEVMKILKQVMEEKLTSNNIEVCVVSRFRSVVLLYILAIVLLFTLLCTILASYTV